MKPNKSRKRVIIDTDESFQTPPMTASVQRQSLSAFGSYRQKMKENISDEARLRLRLLRLRFQINQFLNAQQSEDSFSFFLGFYMKCLELNGKTFAEEINIRPSELSQMLHNRRDPNERLMMRLEIHSNYNFPASLWYEVLAKQKSLELKNDEKLRKEEETRIQPKLELVI